MSDSETATVTSVSIPSHNPPATTTSSYPITTDPVKKLVWYRRLREIKGLLLFLISMAAMLDIINVASITIALPSILRDVGYDTNNLQWCVSAYALTYAAFLLIGGRMGDLFGHKRIFLLGTSWFAIWALVCGFARNAVFMSVARALEGAGAGFTIQTIGVLLGGIFDATIGWQWIFYLTAIISATLSIAGFFIISGHEEKPSTVDNRIDYGGALSFTIGIVAIIYYLTESTTAGWSSSKTLPPLFVGIAFLIGFVILESKIDYPIMPFHIWKSRRFLSSIIIIICLTATYNTMIFYSSLTFQNVLHYDSLITACCYIVHGVGLIIGLYTVTKLFILTRTKVIMFVGWCFVIGSSIIFAQIRPDSTYWHYAFPAFIINCMGLSPTWMCCQVNAVADAKDEDQGIVGAIFNVGVQLGAPIGLAIANIIAEAYTPDTLVDGATSVSDENLMKGYSAAFYAYGVMGGVGLVMMLIFAANRDPAEFSEVAKAPAKELSDLEQYELGGDKEEVLDESIEGEKEVGEEAGQKTDMDSNSSIASLDRTAIPTKKD
ncbi:hypothetical protein BGZ80_008257 [Entomortierella chlamydospora]|uniref:Major facilitator superfamily (MFS) profile domain-containing protein n=1 Tax=Entomortierella chlamydospora TaxID=101097 RepID=A0A9P6T167_9FUNG|nr:hypothetical protein BGZ79_005176 [Entomortierella chlamydospora]KAG0017468.1 hypothetical protein BGZ80_008257 [Entomortierella chlamydospora]